MKLKHWKSFFSQVANKFIFLFSFTLFLYLLYFNVIRIYIYISVLLNAMSFLCVLETFPKRRILLFLRNTLFRIVNVSDIRSHHQ